MVGGVLLCGYLDEFNTMLSANVDSRELRTGQAIDDTWICTFEAFACCFPELAHVVTVESLLDTSMEELQFGDPEFARLGARAQQEILRRHPGLTPVKPETINRLRNGQHVYQWQFGQVARYWLEGSMFEIHANPDSLALGGLPSAWLDPDESRVVVNGRNLAKHRQRNNLLVREIASLLDAGFSVANITMRPPGLKFPSDQYIEVGSFSRSYEVVVHLRELSGALVTVGDSGGVSTHLCVLGNAFVLGKAGWVDNPAFGWKGQSMLAARKSGWHAYQTQHWRHYRPRSVGKRVAEALGLRRSL